MPLSQLYWSNQQEDKASTRPMVHLRYKVWVIYIVCFSYEWTWETCSTLERKPKCAMIREDNQIIFIMQVTRHKNIMVWCMDRFRPKIPNPRYLSTGFWCKGLNLSQQATRGEASQVRNPVFSSTPLRQKLRVQAIKSSSASYSDGFPHKTPSLRQ